MLPKRGSKGPLPLLNPLPARAIPRLSATGPRLKTHRRSRPSGPLAPTSWNPPGPSPTGAFERGCGPPAPAAPGSEQLAARERAATNARGGADKPPALGEGSQGEGQRAEEGKRK